MSQGRGGVRGKVGTWELHWSRAPQGPEGSAFVRVGEGAQIEVRWRRDPDGIWIELADRVRGYDLEASSDDDGVGGYRVSERGGPGEWKGVSFVRSGEEFLGAAAGAKRKGLRIKSQMPGKIVRILVEPGQAVDKDQSLLVMEAMKMENEIRAPSTGTVASLKVSVGQAVESGAELLTLE